MGPPLLAPSPPPVLIHSWSSCRASQTETKIVPAGTGKRRALGITNMKKVLQPVACLTSTGIWRISQDLCTFPSTLESPFRSSPPKHALPKPSPSLSVNLAKPALNPSTISALHKLSGRESHMQTACYTNSLLWFILNAASSKLPGDTCFTRRSHCVLSFSFLLKIIRRLKSGC